MKKIATLWLLSAFLFSVTSINALAVSSDLPITAPCNSSPETGMRMANVDLSEALGRKLTLKERIALGILKRKIKKGGISFPNMDAISDAPIKGCSKIVLKNGDIIEADIIQITPTEVKYKRCGKPNDPEIIVSKKDVLSIKAEDGDVIFRNTGNSGGSNSTAYGEPKLDGLAIASLATGVGGLVIGLLLSGVVGILAGIVGIVLGGISILKMRRDPDKYRGKGMAWAGMICGIVIVGLFVILLALYV